ncbi:hypothetical protein BS17DRAFT_695023 [Gyrodon lividus]|nr:hypothetical protein BS17DRAFT_695023 [Gyrodon lividus]
MGDDHPPPPPDQQQPFSTVSLVPRLVRSFSKVQPTTQQITLAASAEQAASSSVRWISKQKATAIGQFTKFTRRESSGKALGFPPTSWFGDTENSGTDLAEGSSQSTDAGQTLAEVPVNSVLDATKNDPAVVEGESPEPTTLAKKIRDVISTIPSLPSAISTSSSRLWIFPSGPTEAGVDGPPPPAPGSVLQDSHLLAFLTSSDVMNGSLERGRQSVWSALDHLRPPYGKRPDNATSPETSQDTVLDCIDDNNSVMMYGPLEPDDSSEVEIACSEIVSVNGDGEEIRTPQPRFIPLPSESIDQVLMGGGGDFTGSNGWERETELTLEATFIGTEQTSVSGKPVTDQPPVKEYRVWIPSLTKISVQTMWWGFRIYLPPPVLDVLNNKQLEAAKRAAIITTALKWLMDHLPVALLPPQMRPGVAVLRRLVPYLGYMGGLIAWSWSAVRSFDKGYGVVLTATWLLPFALIPGAWEVDDFPPLHTDPQPSTSTSS